LIRHVKRNEIDDAKWNNCIQNDLQHLPYALSFYLDVVAPNWQALILNDYEAVMPLPVKTKYFISYIYMPLYAPQLGIFINESIQLNSETIVSFYNAMPKKVQLVDYGVHSEMQVQDSYGSFNEKANYILSLQENYEKLKQGYKYNNRQAIKKALEKEIKIVEGVDTQQITKLIQLSGVSKAAQFGEVEMNITTSLLNELVKNKIGYSYGIYDTANQLQAVIFYIQFKNRIVNLINASSTIGKQNKWMLVLIDHIIKQHANSNFILDFEGSSIEGIARFFKSFGAEKQHYWHWNWNRLPAVINWLKS